jgi:predicted amidophosphoribosyltransferase
VRFTWPPTQHNEPDPPRPALLATSPPVAPSAPSLLLSIERTWLGLSIPPLSHRIAEARWRPDEPREYCPRCGHSVGPHEADDTGCPACRRRRFPWQRLLRLGPYDGLLREVVQQVKFTRWRRLGHDLGLLLGRALADAIDDAGLPRDRCTLVPVPCSFRRRLSRGIDHSLVLTRGVAAATGLPICRALRRSHRPTQLSVPASERAANVAGSIRPRTGVNLRGRIAILVDDVTTTRATLVAAGKALVAGCKPLPEQGLDGLAGLWIAVAAVTPRPEDRDRIRSADV